MNTQVMRYVRAGLVGFGTGLLVDSIWRAVVGSLCLLVAFWLTDAVNGRAEAS